MRGTVPVTDWKDNVAEPINRAQSWLRNTQLRWAVDRGYLTPSATLVERGRGAGPPTPMKGNHVGDDNALVKECW